MSKLKVHVEGNDTTYQKMFENNGWEIAYNVKDADLVQFVGGADVSPDLYGEEKHPSVYCDKHTDQYSLDIYEHAAYNNIPMVGICRGSQFLCVMGGGKLWQDVNGHATGQGHSLMDIESGIVIEDCSSTHHQQHRPADNAIIIATAFPRLCTKIENFVDGKKYVTVDMDVLNWDETDVEVFYYPHINALGFQPHPEFFNPEHTCQKYYFDLIAKYLKLRSK